MSKWICKTCEMENEEDVSVCSFCGTKRYSQYNKPTGQPADHLNGGNNRSDPYEQTADDAADSRDGSFATDEEDAANAAELRALIKLYEGRKRLFRILILCTTVLQLILFAIPYVYGDDTYTVYHNCLGYYRDYVYSDNTGPTDQICSILLVCITFAPLLFSCMKLKVRMRNLPVTVSVVTALLTTVYSIVIWCSYKANILPMFIILLTLSCVVFAVMMLKTVNELDNAMYRPTAV